MRTELKELRRNSDGSYTASYVHIADEGKTIVTLMNDKCEKSYVEVDEGKAPKQGVIFEDEKIYETDEGRERQEGS